MDNDKKITIDINDLVELIQKGQLQTSDKGEGFNPNAYFNPYAYKILKSCNMDEEIVFANGNEIPKEYIEKMEMVVKGETDTMQYTRTRSYTEAKIKETIKYIFNKKPALAMLGTRLVDSVVAEVQGRSVTQKNLISNELAGTTVTPASRNAINTFGVNLQLLPVQLQQDITLLSIINNKWNPNFVADVLADIEIMLSNDIYLLAWTGTNRDSYANTTNFYDLNKGFWELLTTINGKNTNTYGTVKVVGRNGKFLTPQRIDAVTATGSNYTAANIMSVMQLMWEAMPSQYRDNPNNVFMMARADADLYATGRTALGNATANVIREQILTNGGMPNFQGRSVVVIDDLGSINDTHPYVSALKGCMIFGDPKNLEVAGSTHMMLKTEQFVARGALGATYQYDWTFYLDFQVARPESFVVAYSGATAVTPVAVTLAGNTNGSTGEVAVGTPPNYVVGDGIDSYVYSDSQNVVLVKFYALTAAADAMLSSVNGASTLSAALAIANSGAVIIGQGAKITSTSNGKFFVKAYSPKGAVAASATMTIATA